jgi:RNA polymerase sigma-70 factor (ECF subfamily)
MDLLRKRSRQQQFETPEAELESLPHGSEAPRHDRQIDIRRETESAMRGLTETERAALLLRHFEGHSIKEIAEMLEMTTDACKQAIFRAVQKMRAALQPLVTT